MLTAGLRPASNLGEPPAQPDEQKAPVVEKLGRLTLDVVANELKNPPDQARVKSSSLWTSPSTTRLKLARCMPQNLSLILPERRDDWLL